jgi:hypothetical protein
MRQLHPPPGTRHPPQIEIHMSNLPRREMGESALLCMFTILIYLYSELTDFQAFLRDDFTPATPHPTPIACLESRGWFARADSTPFAIINFRLSTMTDLGHPPRIVQNYVQAYFADASGLQFFEELFSFDKKTSIKDFERRVKDLVQNLQK